MPVIGFSASPPAAQLQLNSNTQLTNAGYFQLSWQVSSVHDESPVYVLQQSQMRDFLTSTTLYQGSDTASALSGLSDGLYYFRVLDNRGNTSNTVTVEVSHHALTKALGFFALGGVMFVILLVVIFFANQNKKG